MSFEKSVAVIVICALCTFGERLLPFLLFSGKKVPDTVTYLGKVLPTAVMCALVVYCLRGCDFTVASSFVPAIVSVAVTAGLHIIKGNTLLSVAGGTVCYMIFVQGVF